jgi:cytochrome c
MKGLSLTVLWILSTPVIGAIAQTQTPPYNIGRVATAEEIRARDISVAPDGSGLPVGKGAASQGGKIYQTLCANCHGDRGEGVAKYPPLVGGRGTLTNKNPKLTVGSYWPYATTVWDYIHRTMPYQRPGTLIGALTADETYAVTAFILYINGIVDEKAELTEKTLPQIRMPNRDGFVADPRPDVLRKNEKTESKVK